MFNLSMMYLKFRIILYFIKINLSSAMTIGAYFIYSISLNSYNNYEIGIILFYRGGNRLRNKISHNRRWWNLNLNQVLKTILLTTLKETILASFITFFCKKNVINTIRVYLFVNLENIPITGLKAVLGILLSSFGIHQQFWEYIFPTYLLPSSFSSAQQFSLSYMWIIVSQIFRISSLPAFIFKKQEDHINFCLLKGR